MRHITADYLIERRKNRKQIVIWKIVSIFFGILLALFLTKKYPISAGSSSSGLSQDHIAQITIEDIIFENKKREQKLKELITQDNVKALIVYVNSPGGTVVGSEKIYNILRKIAATKPVIAVMGSMATSGGYLVSLGADYIICHNGTITGSIGVLFQTAEVTELAKKIGVEFNNFKSGKFKAAPLPTEKVTDDVRRVIMENVDEAYEYFSALVAERRNIPISRVRKIADGRIYTGQMALELGLVDKIGDEDDARKWLVETKNINPELEVIEVNLKAKPDFIEMILDNMETKILGLVNMFSGNKMLAL